MCIFLSVKDGLSDDRALQIYRQQRFEEMKKERTQNRFGDVSEIKKADWIAEVWVTCSLVCLVS